MDTRPNGARSNVEDILRAALGEQVEYKEPNSPIEYYLVKLKEAIDAGGNIDDILVPGANITITKNADGTITIAASGEVSSEDTVARAAIDAIKDGTTIDSFADVESALSDKADVDNVYKLDLSGDSSLPVNTDLDNIKTVGCYYVLSSAVVPTIAHRPSEISSAFRLTVELSAGIMRPRQIYQEFNSYDKYVRYETSSGTWANWKKVEGDLSTFATASQGTKADSAIQGVKVNNASLSPDSNKVVNITVPTTAADVSALPDTTKYAAALSLTINPSTFVMTGQLKDQNGNNLGTAQTIDLPLESVVVNGSYNSQTKKVILTLQSGSTIEFSVADLVAGLQTELSSTNKLNPTFINYDSTHRAVSDDEKTAWNGKQSALDSTQLAAVNSGIDSTKVAQIETNKNNILFVANQGRKNVLKFDSVGGGVRNGITYTVNNDGTIRANGTAIDTSYVYLMFDSSTVDAKEYTNGQFVLSGCPSGGGSNTYSIYAAKGSYAVFDYGNGVILTPTTETQAFIVIRVEKNQTVDIAFKPMIRLVGTDSTFEPYSVPNTVITPELIELVDSGAKNLLSKNELTTASSDRTETLSVNLPAGTYHVSLNASQLADSTIVFKNSVGTVISQTPIARSETIVSEYIELSESAKEFYIYSSNTGTYTSVMLCTKAAWDVSQKYVPYAPTNAELYKQKDNKTWTTIIPTSSSNKKVFTVPIDVDAALIALSVGGDSGSSDSALIAFNGVYETKTVKIVNNIGNSNVSAIETVDYTNGNIVITMTGNKAYKALYRIL